MSRPPENRLVGRMPLVWRPIHGQRRRRRRRSDTNTVKWVVQLRLHRYTRHTSDNHVLDAF